MGPSWPLLATLDQNIDISTASSLVKAFDTLKVNSFEDLFSSFLTRETTFFYFNKCRCYNVFI